ncbi:hypothetical protein ABEH00_20030 [Pantoea agglomerans]|uniref:hypothetical protein n=1 Tax=Enterobacter agglomerans TaxID=549 RepID=UPI0016547A92|nr:hypothetical protein [Pantoea agglomerans]
MKQDDVSIVYSPLVGKSADEILKHFNDYNFIDDHGNRLEFCEDFIILARLASQPNLSDHRKEHLRVRKATKLNL